jgi:uncharacterized sulfatase
MKIAIFVLASLPVLVLSMLSNIRIKLSEYLKSDKPNVIFIVMDDLGYSQVGWTARHISQNDYDPLFLNFSLFNGDYAPEQGLEFARRSTPTLSRMANNGVTFTNAFVSSNLCAPSRLGMATGMFQNRWGVYKNPDSEAHGLKPNSHLAERLKEIGYATAHVGKWHIGSRDNTMIPEFMKKHGIQASDGIYPPLARHPEVKKDMDANGYMGSTVSKHHALNNGFDYYYGYNTWESPFYNADNVWDGFDHASPSPVYNTDLFTDKAIEFIEKSVKQRKPFFVQLHYHAVHGPLDPKAPDNYYDEFDSESFILNNFYAHVFAVDENVRRLEELLSEKGLAENTIIVFTSDNGGAIGGRSPIPGNAPYRGQKGTYFLGGIRVPMVFYWPGEVKKPFISDKLVSALDILPTFIDAAGGSLPDGLDGKSLLPILKGISDEPVHDYLIWSGIHARDWGFMLSTSFLPHVAERREAPWAWGVVKDGYILRYVSETPPGLYKEIPKGRPAHIELYDYRKDPGEKNNIYEQEIDIANDLQGIWEKEAVSFPPSVSWRRDRWEAIMPPENIYLKD